MTNPPDHPMQHSALCFKASGLCAMAGALPLYGPISFTLKSQNALIIQGPNGSGKTTLLKQISGLTTSYKGHMSLYMDNQPDIEFEIGSNAHYLGHDNGLKMDETLGENLEFFAHFMANRPKTDLSPIIETLHLQRLINLPVHLLSAGQKRRAAFARFLIAPRPIWILDEPTAPLDAQISALIDHLCQTHLEGGGLIIAATHRPFLQNSPSVQTLNMQGIAP